MYRLGSSVLLSEATVGSQCMYLCVVNGCGVVCLHLMRQNGERVSVCPFRSPSLRGSRMDEMFYKEFFSRAKYMYAPLRESGICKQTRKTAVVFVGIKMR